MVCAAVLLSVLLPPAGGQAYPPAAPFAYPAYAGDESSPGPVVPASVLTVSWSSVAGAQQYNVFVSKAPYGHANLVAEMETGGTSVSFNLNELPSTAWEFRWGVVAESGAGVSAQSNVRYFRYHPSGPICEAGEPRDNVTVRTGESVTFEARCFSFGQSWRDDAWALDENGDGSPDAPADSSEWSMSRTHSWASPGSHVLKLVTLDSRGHASNYLRWNITVLDGPSAHGSGQTVPTTPTGAPSVVATATEHGGEAPANLSIAPVRTPPPDSQPQTTTPGNPLEWMLTRHPILSSILIAGIPGLGLAIFGAHYQARLSRRAEEAKNRTASPRPRKRHKDDGRS